jgi:hypothetical protein
LSILAAAAASLLLAPTRLEARLVIIEIHYHPQGPAGEAERLEFLEVFNDEPFPFDVAEYRLAGGIEYAFPSGTVAPARGVLVVAKDPVALEAAYAIARPLGPFDGRLGDDGDEVVLLDTGGSQVSRVRYNDRGRWPAAADGAGPSLVLKHPLLETDESESWGWSAKAGGTPGAADFEVAASEARINEVHRGEGGAGWIEIANPSGAPIDLSGYRILGDAGGVQSHSLPAGSQLPGRGFLVVGAAALGFALDGAGQPLFIAAPDGSRIVDARRLGASVAEVSDGLDAGGGERWLRFPQPSPGSANPRPQSAAIAISEIHYNPPGEADDEEFIEIANIGAADVDLGGYAFTDGIDFAFPKGSAIAAGQRLVIARFPDRLREVYGLEGALGPWTGALANGGEMLRLADVLGNPVDELRYYDSGSWSPWADGHGPSLELVDLRQDNTAGSAWRESALAERSEWRDYEYVARQGSGDSEIHLYLLDAGEALIDSIEVAPARGGPNQLSGGDFEGQNPLAGWVFDGTHIDSRLEIGGGPDGSNALRIVASGAGDERVNRIERQTAPALVAGQDYRVRFKARWLRGSSLLMTRSWNHGLARVTRLAVPPAGGTPGRPNSAAADNDGPAIDGVTQSPALPKPEESPRVTARIRDPDGVRSAMLRFRADGAAEFSAAAMRDDGVEPDVVAGDGVYAARIEGVGAARAVAEFYLEAEDGRGALRSEPAAAPEASYLYQYDDGARVHEIPAYRLVLRARDHQTLLRRSQLSNHLLPASFIHRDERIIHLAGLRYRGSPYLRQPEVTGPRKGFRLRLPDENPFAGELRLTLDEQAVDPAAQVDRVVRHFLQKAGGIPYGERRHVQLFLRGAPFPNTYEHVLHVDDRYLERAYGEDGADGDLYKVDAHYEIDDQGEFPFPRFTSWRFTEDKEALRHIYRKRSREDLDDFSSLMELLRLMDLSLTPNEAFDAQIAERIDVEAWVKSIAVYRAVEDWDAIGGWTGKNVFLYLHPDGRWRVIPWDHDVALGSAALQADQNPRAYLYTPYFPEIRRLLQRPVYDRLFNAELLRLLAEDYDRAVLDPVLDATFAVLSRASGAVQPVKIKNFISARRAYLLSQVKDPPAFTIETNGGAPVITDAAELLLWGKAPYRVAAILLDGFDDPPAVAWRDRETWELTAPLALGQSELRLFAFDGEGALVASASIQATRAGGGTVFLRGDANGDGGADISDAVRILDYLFQGGDVACEDAADVDDSGKLNLTDPIVLLDYLFRAGEAPPPPFPLPGEDASADTLVCER